MKMLKECDQITINSTYRKVASLLEKDERFQAIESDGEREELFEEYVFQLEKKQREDAKAVRRENMKKFKEIFETHPLVNVRSRWRDIKDTFKNDATYKALERIDRLKVFEDHIRTLEKKRFRRKKT